MRILLLFVLANLLSFVLFWVSLYFSPKGSGYAIFYSWQIGFLIVGVFSSLKSKTPFFEVVKFLFLSVVGAILIIDISGWLGGLGPVGGVLMELSCVIAYITNNKKMLFELECGTDTLPMNIWSVWGIIAVLFLAMVMHRVFHKDKKQE